MLHTLIREVVSHPLSKSLHHLAKLCSTGEIRDFEYGPQVFEQLVKLMPTLYLSNDFDIVDMGYRIVTKIISVEEFDSSITDAETHFSGRVIFRFMKRLSNPDSDNREYPQIQFILSTLYRKMPAKRPLMRKIFGEGLTQYVDVSALAVKSLLKVITPIISGFRCPIHDANHSLLTILLSLHGPTSMENEVTPTIGIYHKQVIFNGIVSSVTDF